MFSDKTGTLTCNQMEFKQCSVNNVVYGEPLKEITGLEKTVPLETVAEILKNEDETEDKLKLREFFLLCSLCHSVVPDLDKKTNTVVFQVNIDN